jgi:Na+/H+-dicarboxylate symporter
LHEKKLWLKILIAMGLGVTDGAFLGPFGGYVDPVYAELIGEWIALLPVIFSWVSEEDRGPLSCLK